MDEHTRECLGGLVERSITADRFIDHLEELIAQRGAPVVLRSDNGYERHLLVQYAYRLAGRGELQRGRLLEGITPYVRDRIKAEDADFTELLKLPTLGDA